MISPLIITTIIYVVFVLYCVEKLTRQQEQRYEEDLAQIENECQKFIERKEYYQKEKLDLENQSMQIFALYEMTKEVTQSLHEHEAFDIFRKELRAHVVFDDCRLVDVASAEVNDFLKSGEYFVFTLAWKKNKMGYLAIKGVQEKDKEIAMILGHQFALALRRVRLYEEIEKVAITDSLTEVHTRRYTLERLDEELKRSRLRKIKLSFLMIDVDSFKNINDTYGHLAGDQILQEVGLIIKENIREIDIAGRYGGEEFSVILPDTDRLGAQNAAERIRKATEERSIKAYDTTVRVTLSVGITTFPEDGDQLQEMIDKADWALYRAKKLGRNQVCSFGVFDT